MLMKRRFLGLCAFAASLMSLSVAGAADKPPIKIGAILPLSGFQSAYGTMYRVALTLAAQDINKAGGVNGSQIELLVADDQGMPADSVTVFRRHVSDGVFASLGPISGTTWENVAPLANALKTPALNWTALKPNISKRPYALRLHPADDKMVPEGVAEFLIKFPGVKKVAIAGDLKEASGASGVEEVKKAAQARGLEVVDTVGFDTRTTDFSPTAIKLRGLAPDAVFLSAFVPNVLALLKELEAQGFQKPLLVNALIWAGSFPQVVGPAGKNVYTIGFNTNEPRPDIKGQDDYVARYLKTATEISNLPQPANIANTTLAYDTMMLLVGILREKKIDGTTDVQKAREAVMESLASLKQWQGFNQVMLLESGDGYIRSHLLEVDLAKKIWKYSLPADVRRK